MKATLTWAGVVCIVVLGALLYRSGLNYPAVFDDFNIIGDGSVFDHALARNFSNTRALPYFLIGFLHVLGDDDLLWNRLCSLFLHGLVGVALFCFVRRAMGGGRAPNGGREVLGLVVVLWFTLNPVSVYGTGYLIQRSIVMATLFALVSMTLYLRAQQEQRNADLISAALLGGLAMMSKEHAVLLPLAVLVFTPLVVEWRRDALLRAAGFLALSIPFMLWALLHRVGTEGVGARYEIYAADVLTQMAVVDSAQSGAGLWLLSIGTQILLFWKYLALWLLPNPAWMSADLRVDFDALWSGWGGPVGVALSLAGFALAFRAWWRHGGATLSGRLATALLFVAVLFGVEFSVVRVQEPFVLYRSFLWMPGYALILAFLLLEADRWAAGKGVVWQRGLWVAAVLACLGLFPLAQDRLRSFSSEEALWRDAEAKLPRLDVAGADRIYYNLAGEAFKRKDYTTALAYSDKVIRQNPGAFQGYLARGTSRLALRDVDGAWADFSAADRHNPPGEFRGYIEFKRCGVYSLRGERDEVLACLRRSARLGYEPAKFHLRMAGLEE